MANVATNANFADILSSNKVVLVDFWATWCGPCRMLSPTVDEVAEEMAGSVAVVKCNVDDCDEIAMQYGIRSIPTLIYFKDGQVADRTVGVVSKSTIVDKLKALI
ncbi:MAG: thioredoxin [Bacteroidales bacterium]|nr:thioredoxin [Bacteroidales bacterium]